jgi:hypothetical protein
MGRNHAAQVHKTSNFSSGRDTTAFLVYVFVLSKKATIVSVFNEIHYNSIGQITTFLMKNRCLLPLPDFGVLEGAVFLDL